MSTIAVADPAIIGQTVWAQQTASSRRQRLLVDRVEDLGDDTYLVLGRLARKITENSPYALGDARGFYSVLVKTDHVFELVESDTVPAVILQLVQDGIFTSAVVVS